MSTETTNKKIKIDNGTTFGRTYTDKAIDAKLPTDLIASANKLSLGVGNTALGNGVNLDGFTYDESTKTLKASGGEGGISVIELTDKNGTIASTQLNIINANPQNFAFKYNGKILLFTSADNTTYQYCNNTTNSSDNNVMTTSTLLTITSSTGAYTIANNVHNVVANSIHPANGGDLTNIQVGSKVYSIPSGGGGGSSEIHVYMVTVDASFQYMVYMTKDYGWEIGETIIIRVSDFMTNDNYKELEPKGKLPASGFYYDNSQNKELVLSEIESTNPRGFFILHGINLVTKKYETVQIGGNIYEAVKLF